MKNKIIYLALAIILSSCGMSNNFNSQKFTSLKKIKPAKTESTIETFENDEQIAAEGQTNAEYMQTETADDAPTSEFDQESTDLIENNDTKNETANSTQGSRKIEIKSTTEKKYLQLNEGDDELSEEERKENNMFAWMMVMFLLAAPASLFVIIPAIPFYLTAFILAILLIKRINAIDPKEQTVKQQRRKNLAIWVLIQWIIGLGIFWLLMRNI